MISQRFIEQVELQLKFIERSCATFDGGAADEAIRIATPVRVLFHNAKNTTSLVSRFNRPHIHLLATTKKINPKDYYLAAGYLSRASVSFKDGALISIDTVPNLGSEDVVKHRLVPLEEWWREPVYVFGDEVISRSDLVLWATNKDGGAHVDPDLPALYQKVIEGYLHIEVVESTGLISVAVRNAHLADLRQIGYEVLNSPCLRALCR